jgi:hypothetical protein
MFSFGRIPIRPFSDPSVSPVWCGATGCTLQRDVQRTRKIDDSPWRSARNTLPTASAHHTTARCQRSSGLLRWANNLTVRLCKEPSTKRTGSGARDRDLLLIGPYAPGTTPAPLAFRSQRRSAEGWPKINGPSSVDERIETYIRSLKTSPLYHVRGIGLHLLGGIHETL